VIKLGISETMEPVLNHGMRTFQCWSENFLKKYQDGSGVNIILMLNSKQNLCMYLILIKFISSNTGFHDKVKVE
jgi:hypothetical protein